MSVKRPVSNIKFIHCRNVNDNGSVTPHGGLTIAYVLDKKFQVIGWAAAKCHVKDLYNKHVGRAKAAGRLLSSKYYQIVKETDEKEFIQKSKEGYKNAF